MPCVADETSGSQVSSSKHPFDCAVLHVWLAGPRQRGSVSASDAAQESGAESGDGGGGGNILMEDDDAANAHTQRLLRGEQQHFNPAVGPM